MGEVQGNISYPQFNRSIKVQATDHRIPSNVGVLLLREAHQHAWINAHPERQRVMSLTPKNK